MKTLKDLLLERHRSVEPKLDAAREELLAHLESSRAPVRREPSGLEHLWLECLLPLRWHLAGIGAAWIAILLLHGDTLPDQPRLFAQATLPAPQQVLAILLQHRQEILELTQPPPTAPASMAPRRSDVQPPTAIV